MNILRKAWDAVSRPWRLSDDTIPRMGLTSHAGESVSESGALALSTVWACVNLLAGTIAAMPIDLQRRGPGGAPVSDDSHPLARVLRDSPNADQTPMDFWEHMCLSLELRGNAYARIVRSGGRIIALEPIAPGAVSVRRLSSGGGAGISLVGGWQALCVRRR